MEIEQNLLNNKLKTITAYYGELVLEGETTEEPLEETDDITGSEPTDQEAKVPEDLSKLNDNSELDSTGENLEGGCVLPTICPNA